ncbi:LOW QUALITY PROTEIN: metal transporter Nramp4-like [Phragmites australis]|uniref:LOW QUALITY PROTEIN: metal transporter Nramp4-like n=1 Tax=Phragmites australis TaxID=29695 RepID=UPI002D7782A6|nr:LOW QUALITY PROTEIN: metal transporter Nramp4-like [Phragmites australis]
MRTAPSYTSRNATAAMEEAGRRIEREEQQRGRGSGRVAAVEVGGGSEIEIEMEAASAGCGVSSSGQQDHVEDGLLQRPTWKRFLAHAGPGFLISLAYLDPSNVQTDLQAGSSHKYELLWVLFFGFIFVLIIQSLAANLGIITGRHLAELCMCEYPKYVKYCLWLLAEVGVIAATIPGVLGTALAYNMLLHIPFWAGVLICGASTLLLLGLQCYGAQKMELVGVIFMLVMAACFFVELSTANPPMGEVIKGLFVPRLQGVYATSDAVALFSALVMPHNLFLHSSLVLSRNISSSPKAVKDASKFFLIENAFALFLVLLVNVSIVSITGTICAGNELVDDINTCSSLTLISTSGFLKNLFGKSRSTIYGLALLASGQSCTVITSYSGQYIMQGFSGMRKCIIYLIAPCFTVIPSLIICSIGGALSVRQLINISAIILAFALPYALIPLLKFSSSCAMIGPYKYSIYIVRFTWILSTVIMGVNIYFFCNSFINWLVHSELPRIVNAIISTLIFPFMAAYIAVLIYLVFRKVSVASPFPSMSVSCETEVEEVQRQDDKVDDFSVH